MKPNRVFQGNVDVSSLSIPEAEEMIEEALSELAYSSDPGLTRALHFLAPPGYQAIVELCSESGRSKRRNSFAESWSPEEDEVRIYFERISDQEPTPRPGSSRGSHSNLHDDEEDDTQEAQIPADLDMRVKELCA